MGPNWNLEYKRGSQQQDEQAAATAAMDKLLLPLLLLFASYLMVSADIRCQGDRNAIASNATREAVKQAFQELVNSINTSATYQNGVSFTTAVTHTDSCSKQTVVRLLVWDEERCLPGTDAFNSNESVTIKYTFRDFLDFWGYGQPLRGYGWATMVFKSFIVDYYTVGEAKRPVNYRPRDRIGSYCSSKDATKDDCSIRKSNIISGNNGVFSVLREGERLVSPNELYYVEMQKDCNLVVYKSVDDYMTSPVPLWATNTYGKGTLCFTELGTDLNLVLYASLPHYGGASNGSLSNGTSGIGGGYHASSNGTMVWSKLWESLPTSKLAKNFTLASNPATGVLTMQNDGNLVIYATDLVVTPIWASGTSGKK